MDIGIVTTLIQDLGFPIAAVIGMAIFALNTSKAAREDNNKAMEMLQQRCLAREERMSEQLGRNENICDTVTKDRQDLYLHPASFSGVLIVAVEGMLIICDTVIVEINVFVHVDTDLAGAGRTENVRYMQVPPIVRKVSHGGLKLYSKKFLD